MTSLNSTLKVLQAVLQQRQDSYLRVFFGFLNGLSCPLVPRNSGQLVHQPRSGQDLIQAVTVPFIFPLRMVDVSWIFPE